MLLKKRVLFLTGLVLIWGVVLLAGCGQQLPAVDLKNPQPKGLSVNGKVYETLVTVSTSYNYYYGTNYDKPLVGALATLSGSTTKSATTDANGQYVFTDVLPGNYTVTVSREGYQPKSVNGQFDSLTSNIPDNFVLTMPNVDLNPLTKIQIINIIDSAEAAGDKIEVIFNKSMNTDTIVVDLIYNGMRAQSVTGSMAIDKNWNSDKKILTIVPREGLRAGAMYSLTIKGQDNRYSSIRDAEGNHLSLSRPDGTGFLSFAADSIISVGIFTGTAIIAAPAAPANLTVKANSAALTGALDFKDVNSADSNIYLSWTGTREATAYKIYVSYDGSPYQYLGRCLNANSNGVVLSPASIDTVLPDFERSSPSSYFFYPNASTILPWPYLGRGMDFKVTAVNVAGESQFSDILNVKDNVSPEVVAVANNSSQSSEVKVYFSEPIDRTLAQITSNYTLEGQTITTALLVNNPSRSSSYINGTYMNFGSYVTLTISPGTTSGTVEVDSSVTDVTGNPINVTRKSGQIGVGGIISSGF
ncbi:carboxypeptidase regulatory-like domain-containing protein [Candidatus Saganbacteria bacterium]|nr:carboxypeptidase regulatory-like domain-containing protein [Candidatus Saganbacteria bacterium]